MVVHKRCPLQVHIIPYQIKYRSFYRNMNHLITSPIPGHLILQILRSDTLSIVDSRDIDDSICTLSIRPVSAFRIYLNSNFSATNRGLRVKKSKKDSLPAYALAAKAEKYLLNTRHIVSSKIHVGLP